MFFTHRPVSTLDRVGPFQLTDELFLYGTTLSASGAVLECLKRNHAARNVTDEACAADITRRMASSASDIRGDAPLVAACASDLKSHCAEVTPGEGKLWACLEKYESVLSPSCAAKLSERSQWAGEDWRANPKIAAACAAEASSLCADVKPGRGRVVECLRAAADAEVRSIHWFPYDRVGVVNADP